MYKTFLADSDEAFAQKLQQSLNDTLDFSAVGCTSDGEYALTYITHHKPDVIIMDPLLENLDGLNLLQHIRFNMADYKPKIYIISEMNTKTFKKLLSHYDVDHYSIKPVNTEAIIQNLYSIVNLQYYENEIINKSKDDQETYYNLVTQIFVKFGVHSHLLSSKQTIDAIVFGIENKALLFNFRKHLYPKVGDKYGVSMASVERNVRTVAQKVMKKQSELYIQLFRTQRITNTLFINTIVDYIEKTI